MLPKLSTDFCTLKIKKKFTLKDEQLLAILRLQKTKLIGDILAKKLINIVGDVEAIFKETNHKLSKINGIGELSLKALQDTTILKKAEKELAYIQKEKLQVSYFLDNDYPENLKHCIDAPILFFYDGTIEFSTQKIISIVGTRNITPYGKELCKQLVKDLEPYKPTIVSGFAYGVDIEAHKAAIENNLQTIAVLAHGFEQIYPKVHKKYMHQVNENGGFVSEFWHDEDPLRENFLKRNRIVAGLSKATIIIESAEKAGSLVTADIANSYNRDVFAFPGKVTDIFSKGCNSLIRHNKAHLLESANDVVQHLNWDINTKPQKNIQKQIFVDLNENELKIFNYLKNKNQENLDIIALETQIPIYQLAPILLQMELKGVIKPLPGKVFGIY